MSKMWIKIPSDTCKSRRKSPINASSIYSSFRRAAKVVCYFCPYSVTDMTDCCCSIFVFPLLIPPVLHQVEAGTPVMGNDVFEGKLVVVEKVAYAKGLPPDAISVMLEFAMSLRMGKMMDGYVILYFIHQVGEIQPSRS